jgi:hypothetical protein
MFSPYPYTALWGLFIFLNSHFYDSTYLITAPNKLYK